MGASFLRKSRAAGLRAPRRTRLVKACAPSIASAIGRAVPVAALVRVLTLLYLTTYRFDVFDTVL